MIETWGTGPHEEWFEHIYTRWDSDEQFLWGKVFITDQLLGRIPHPGAINIWATGESVKFGINPGRFLGIGCLCNIDKRNMAAELKILIDPRIAPTGHEIERVVREILKGAFADGYERIYGYVPCTGGKAFRIWERVMKRVARRVGHEKHAIRTRKRWIGRTLFEAVKE